MARQRRPVRYRHDARPSYYRGSRAEENDCAQLLILSRGPPQAAALRPAALCKRGAKPTTAQTPHRISTL